MMSHRDDHNHARSFLRMAILLFTCLGCGATATEPVVTADSVTIDHFTESGVLWSKQDTLDPTDQKILAQFFHTQPAWRDSTEVEGEPVVYTSDDQRRFYWIRSAKQDAVWTCVHWEKKRFRTSSGVGPLSPPTN